jgi:hypothetical protein
MKLTSLLRNVARHLQDLKSNSVINGPNGTISSQILRSRYANLIGHKLDAIDFAFSQDSITSFADLGGLWGVHGGYTFYTIDSYGCDAATLVDTHPTEEFLKTRKSYPQLNFIQGDFGSSTVAERVGQVDAVFLFDVLLHQVAPSWNDVLKMYASRTRCLVIYNQQWTGSDTTVRLLDLGEDGYFQNVPHSRTQAPYDNLFQKLDEKHPAHDKTWRDVHHIWQWGITDTDLKRQMAELGFHLRYFKNGGRFGKLKCFENHAFVFQK